MIRVTEMTRFFNQKIGTYETIEDAVKFNNIVFYEEDEDHPGHYDMITKSGRVFQAEVI